MQQIASSKTKWSRGRTKSPIRRRTERDAPIDVSTEKQQHEQQQQEHNYSDDSHEIPRSPQLISCDDRSVETATQTMRRAGRRNKATNGNRKSTALISFLQQQEASPAIRLSSSQSCQDGAVPSTVTKLESSRKAGTGSLHSASSSVGPRGPRTPKISKQQVSTTAVSPRAKRTPSRSTNPKKHSSSASRSVSSNDYTMESPHARRNDVDVSSPRSHTSSRTRSKSRSRRSARTLTRKSSCSSSSQTLSTYPDTSSCSTGSRPRSPSPSPVPPGAQTRSNASTSICSYSSSISTSTMQFPIIQRRLSNPTIQEFAARRVHLAGTPMATVTVSSMPSSSPATPGDKMKKTSNNNNKSKKKKKSSLNTAVESNTPSTRTARRSTSKNNTPAVASTPTSTSNHTPRMVVLDGRGSRPSSNGEETGTIAIDRDELKKPRPQQRVNGSPSQLLRPIHYEDKQQQQQLPLEEDNIMDEDIFSFYAWSAVYQHQDRESTRSNRATMQLNLQNNPLYKALASMMLVE